MTGIKYYPISPNVRVILEPHPTLQLPAKLEEEVEAIWQTENMKRTLYDALIFSVHSFTESQITGKFVHYRYYIASLQSLKLQHVLKIYPLGVSAVTMCRDMQLVGIRDKALTSYPGYYESVPSGGIEARAYMQGEVDFVAQAMWELAEEAHIGEQNVLEVHPLGLFYSEEDHVYDIGLKIEVALLEQEMDPYGSSEYPFLEWYGKKEFTDKFINGDAKIVPLSRALWQRSLC